MDNKHALLLSDSVIEAMRQATIEMKDSKYLKEDEGGDRDDPEADGDKDLFKKRTHKNGGKKEGFKKEGFKKEGFKKDSGKSGKSFVRKRQRVN